MISLFVPLSSVSHRNGRQKAFQFSPEAKDSLLESIHCATTRSCLCIPSSIHCHSASYHTVLCQFPFGFVAHAHCASQRNWNAYFIKRVMWRQILSFCHDEILHLHDQCFKTIDPKPFDCFPNVAESDYKNNVQYCILFKHLFHQYQLGNRSRAIINTDVNFAKFLAICTRLVTYKI